MTRIFHVKELNRFYFARPTPRSKGHLRGVRLLSWELNIPTMWPTRINHMLLFWSDVHTSQVTPCLWSWGIL
jgi:hypothetical protein